MKKIVFVLSFFAFAYACSSGNSGNDDSGDGFNRTELLTNWADNIIVPGYQNYQSKVQSLVTSTNTFTETPTETNLQTLRTAWINAYKAYQCVTMYNFGKAQEIYFREATNTYPTDTAGIEANIASGIYDLSVISQFPREGMPAIDYMLNGLASNDADIIAFYTTNSNASGYKKYLTDLANRLQTNIDAIVTSWNSGYRNTYVSSNGNSTSSSVNITTNNFVKNIEKDIRAGKVGIPSGIFSAGVLYPEKVEAYYKNDISKELLNASIQASKDFFNGKHFNSSATGASLKSYLDYLNATKGGQKLSDVINNQYTTIFSATDALNNSFSQQINDDNSKMIAAYNTLQELVVLTKLDMMEALKISIDYVDSDGD